MGGNCPAITKPIGWAKINDTTLHYFYARVRRQCASCGSICDSWYSLRVTVECIDIVQWFLTRDCVVYIKQEVVRCQRYYPDKGVNATEEAIVAQCRLRSVRTDRGHWSRTARHCTLRETLSHTVYIGWSDVTESTLCLKKNKTLNSCP